MDVFKSILFFIGGTVAGFIIMFPVTYFGLLEGSDTDFIVPLALLIPIALILYFKKQEWPAIVVFSVSYAFGNYIFLNVFLLLFFHIPVGL